MKHYNWAAPTRQKLRLYWLWWREGGAGLKTVVIDTRSVPPDRPGGVISVDLLFLHDSVAGWWHAVDTHVCRPVTIANCDRKSSEVCPNDLDCLLAAAGNFQTLPFALVSSFVAGSIGANSWNYNKHFTGDHWNVSARRKGRKIFYLFCCGCSETLGGK